MQHRYRALRIVGTVYKIIGVIVLILAVLGAIGSVIFGGLIGGLARQSATGPFGSVAGGAFGGLIVAVLVLLYGLGIGVTLYGVGEGIYLLLALEENTRETATLLRPTQGAVAGAPSQPVAPPPPAASSPTPPA